MPQAPLTMRWTFSSLLSNLGGARGPLWPMEGCRRDVTWFPRLVYKGSEIIAYASPPSSFPLCLSLSLSLPHSRFWDTATMLRGSPSWVPSKQSASTTRLGSIWDLMGFPSCSSLQISHLWPQISQSRHKLSLLCPVWIPDPQTPLEIRLLL